MTLFCPQLDHHLYAYNTQICISSSRAGTDHFRKDISGWMTKINLGSIPTNRIYLLKIHANKAAKLLFSSLRASLVIASNYQTLYAILVLHLIAILILENMFLRHVVPASIIFLTFCIFGAIFLFHSPKPLIHHSLLVDLISITLFFITLHLRIS